MNNYNICIIGDVNYGKTTIASIISSVKFGSIKRRQSTFKYTVLEQTKSVLECTRTETDDLVTLYSSNRYLGDTSYTVSLYDSIALTDEASYDKFNKMKRIFDMLIIVFDASYGMTENMKTVLKVFNNTLNIFVLNKYDDPEDDELNENYYDVTDYLIQNNFINKEQELLKLSSLPIYETIFNGKSKKALNYHSLYKNIDEECGKSQLLKAIKDQFTVNKDQIFNNRLKYLENDSLSLKQIVFMYNECKKYADIKNSLSHYIKKAIDIDVHSSCADVEESDEESDNESEDEFDNDETCNESNIEQEDETEMEVDDEIDNESCKDDDEANESIKGDNIDIFDDVKSVLNYFDDKLKGYIIGKYLDMNSSVDINKYLKYFGDDDVVCNSFHVEYIVSSLLDDIGNSSIDYEYLEELPEYLKNIKVNNKKEIKEKLDDYLHKIFTFVFDILDSCKSSKSKVLQKYPQYWLGLKMLFDNNNATIKEMKCNLSKFYKITSVKSLNAINECIKNKDYNKLDVLDALLKF